MSNKSFEEAVREWERQDFPDFAKWEQYEPQDRAYWHYSLSWHFRKGLLTEELVEDIRENGKQILSVGTGEAHLERLLVSRLGLKNEQIVISDKDPVMPEGFERYVFNMLEAWPDFGKQFDYILFPCSAIRAGIFYHDAQRFQSEFYHVIQSSLSSMKSKGQIRMDMAMPLREDVNDFNPILNWLERDHPDSRFVYSPNLLVVERGYKK